MVAIVRRGKDMEQWRTVRVGRKVKVTLCFVSIVMASGGGFHSSISRVLANSLMVF